MNQDELEQKILEIIADSKGEPDFIPTSAILKLINERDFSNMLFEFHKAFKLVHNKKPVHLDLETQKLRYSLILEELEELGVAYDEKNLVKQLDAYVDLLYVVFGSIVSSGMQDIIIEAFQECHRSNMSKLVDSPLLSDIKFKRKKDELYSLEPSGIDGMFIIKRSDGKVIKPDSYSEADFAQFIVVE